MTGTEKLPKMWKTRTILQQVRTAGIGLARQETQKERFMVTFRAQAVIAAVATLSLGTWGCATKKHVREAIAPVQQQVNQVQKDTATNKTAIGDLDRTVAGVDEKVMD